MKEMVMEIPNPQFVGREFVRQYYTVLNKAPYYLHRFYSDNSTFAHGGLNNDGQAAKQVVGQCEIHATIMSLGFKDCHAKIIQVDSHQSLENSVIVQVTGELSNNGMPMRRFVQTFMLAPQTPKKFYVRNDIFRYQDDGCNEEEIEENLPEEEEAIIQPVEELATPSIESVYYEPERNGQLEEIPQAIPEPQEIQEWSEAPLEVSLSEQPELKTYANMVSKTASNTGSISASIPQSVSPIPSPNANTKMAPLETSPNASMNNKVDEENERRKSLYPDSQQLFVGNLTHAITEEELKEFFGKYGTVLDCRINKQTTQVRQGGKVPNFGFVVFDNPDVVGKVLEEKPIFFKNHRLNVEEKKLRSRGIGGGGGARGGPMRGGPRGGRSNRGFGGSRR